MGGDGVACSQPPESVRSRHVGIRARMFNVHVMKDSKAGLSPRVILVLTISPLIDYTPLVYYKILTGRRPENFGFLNVLKRPKMRFLAPKAAEFFGI